MKALDAIGIFSCLLNIMLMTGLTDFIAINKLEL